MIRPANIVFIFLFSFHSFSQTPLLIEDFNSGIPTTWTVLNEDGLTPQSQVSEFTDGWISFVDGSDTCAASTSYYDPAGQSEDYLITPKLSLATFSKITWEAKSFDSSFPDGYYVLISTTDSMPSSFTDTLLTVSSEAPYWTYHSIHLDVEGYANQDVFIAFRNFTNDGFILEIDNFEAFVSDFASVENEALPELSVYPNPAIETVSITLVNNDPFEIEIYNIDGKSIITTYSHQIDVSSLESGTYFIVYRSAQATLTSTFVKK